MKRSMYQRIVRFPENSGLIAWTTSSEHTSPIHALEVRLPQKSGLRRVRPFEVFNSDRSVLFGTTLFSPRSLRSYIVSFPQFKPGNLSTTLRGAIYMLEIRLFRSSPCQLPISQTPTTCRTLSYFPALRMSTQPLSPSSHPELSVRYTC